MRISIPIRGLLTVLICLSGFRTPVRAAAESPEEQRARDVYNRAIRFHIQGMYIEAAVDFGTHRAMFRPYKFDDKALYYYASSCLRLGLYRTVEAICQQLQEDHPASPLVNASIALQIEARYRTDRDRELLEAYISLQDRTDGQTGIPAADYHAGQVLQRMGRYADAIQCFVMVPESDAYYPYARYSLAQCRLYLEDAADALTHLEAAAGPQTGLSVKARIIKGYLLYELRRFKEAEEELRTVPYDSPWHKDALLGLAWCALSQKQWDNTIRLAGLVARTAREPQSLEAGILAGYAYILTRDYIRARTTLEPLVKNAGAQKKKPVTPLEYAQKEAAVYRYRKELAALETELTANCVLADTGSRPAAFKKKFEQQYSQLVKKIDVAENALAFLDRRMKNDALTATLTEEAVYALQYARHLETVMAKRAKLSWYDNLLKDAEKKLLDRLHKMSASISR